MMSPPLKQQQLTLPLQRIQQSGANNPEMDHDDGNINGNNDATSNDDLKSLLLTIQQQIATVSVTVSSVDQRCNSMQSELKEVKNENKELRTENTVLKSRVSQLEGNCESLYRNVGACNLVINGMEQQLVNEPPGQTQAMVKDLLKNLLKIEQEIQLSTVYRMKNARSANKPVMVNLYVSQISISSSQLPKNI